LNLVKDMANKVWAVKLEDGRHTVELEHGYFSGKRIIRVDGEQLESTTSIIDFGGEHSFQIGNHTGIVHIRTNGLTYNYDLSIDGRSIGTGKEVSASGPLHAWVWIFVAGCGLIPLVSLGGALPAAIGFGGAAGCYAIGKDDSKEVATRVMLCAGVTVLCWVLFVGLILLIRGAA
jgi:hypothetical protein